MSKIFELLGYPLDSSDATVLESRRNARCPFTESECDGGGNRYLSALSLEGRDELREYFAGKSKVQAGVCSLMVGDKPWIVCPRRLLAFRGENASPLQAQVRESLSRYGNLTPGVKYRVWSEVRMDVPGQEVGAGKGSFTYTFDYVVADRRAIQLSDVAKIVDMSETVCLRTAENNGMTVARRDGVEWIDDFPCRPLVIVEVMSSSTSGGNKTDRTQIGMAFEDAILRGDKHKGPGINYRQVWARMASQLIVKSQVGVAWGAKTIWILQDVLADYISATTGLDLEAYVAQQANEVNVLALGYGDVPKKHESGALVLDDTRFYAGPISTDTRGRAGFVDIVKVGFVPPVQRLWRALFRKKPSGLLGPVSEPRSAVTPRAS